MSSSPLKKIFVNHFVNFEKMNTSLGQISQNLNIIQPRLGKEDISSQKGMRIIISLLHFDSYLYKSISF